jgi:prevent-host-death family protein
MEMTSIEFKSKCLELMDQVNDSHEEVVITKNGSPEPKLVPYKEIIFLPGTVFYQGCP